VLIRTPPTSSRQEFCVGQRARAAPGSLAGNPSGAGHLRVVPSPKQKDTSRFSRAVPPGRPAGAKHGQDRRRFDRRGNTSAQGAGRGRTAPRPMERATVDVAPTVAAVGADAGEGNRRWRSRRRRGLCAEERAGLSICQVTISPAACPRASCREKPIVGEQREAGRGRASWLLMRRWCPRTGSCRAAKSVVSIVRPSPSRRHGCSRGRGASRRRRRPAPVREARPEGAACAHRGRRTLACGSCTDRSTRRQAMLAAVAVPGAAGPRFRLIRSRSARGDDVVHCCGGHERAVAPSGVGGYILPAIIAESRPPGWSAVTAQRADVRCRLAVHCWRPGHGKCRWRRAAPAPAEPVARSRRAVPRGQRRGPERSELVAQASFPNMTARERAPARCGRGRAAVKQRSGLALPTRRVVSERRGAPAQPGATSAPRGSRRRRRGRRSDHDREHVVALPSRAKQDESSTRSTGIPCHDAAQAHDGIEHAAVVPESDEREVSLPADDSADGAPRTAAVGLECRSASAAQAPGWPPRPTTRAPAHG